MIATTNPKPSDGIASTFLPTDCTHGGSMRKAIRQAARWGLLKASVPFRTIFGSQPTGSFGILMYHRISPRIAGFPSPTWNVTPKRFRQQMIGLLRRGFQPWPLREALEHHRKNLPIPQKTFVITFDDGYANNHEYAWPILHELQIPATIFLATAYLDTDAPFPSDDWSAAGDSHVPAVAWQPLSTEQCCEMLEDRLIELGAHTHTHQDFRNRPDDLRDDLAVCLTTLRNKFGLQDATFAFPFGTKRLGFSGPVLAEAAKQAGVLCSLTTEDELVQSAICPFDWGRFTAEQSDTARTLAVKLTGMYQRMRQSWRRLRGKEARFH